MDRRQEPMRSFEPGPNRSDLGFVPTAEREFAFLLDAGCRIAGRQTTLLAYVCPSTYVNVYHGRGGYDLGVEVGLLADRNMNADLTGLMVVQGKAVPNIPPAETADAVERGLSELARLFQAHAALAVEGQRWIFEMVRDHNRELTARYMDPIARARYLAEAAWDRGDRVAAAGHYAEIEHNLTAVEQERLLSGRRVQGTQ
jgi:hypothetical protein